MYFIMQTHIILDVFLLYISIVMQGQFGCLEKSVCGSDKYRAAYTVTYIPIYDCIIKYYISSYAKINK
jgi:hypothetical protein